MLTYKSDSVILRNGVDMPLVGLGCAQLEDNGEEELLISKAFEYGYRLFDNAHMYLNEKLIGKAIKAAGRPRESYMVSSKVHGNMQGYDNTLKFFEISARDLCVDYLDIYLIHWPALDEETFKGTWKAMERLYNEGAVKSIGVSNFMSEDIEALMAIANEAPFVNQIEFNPYLAQKEVRACCDKYDIVCEGYFPLGGKVEGSKGPRRAPPEVQLFENPVMLRLGEKYGKTAAQIVMRWETQSGVVIVPKTTKVARLKENISLFDFRLTDEEMAEIDALDMNFQIAPDKYIMNTVPYEAPPED